LTSGGGDADKPTALAYCAPEKYTEGTWNFFLIALHSDLRVTGIGTKIVQYLEQQLIAQKNARVLLVETSGSPEYDGTQKFYQKRGFVEEARIREYYQAGEDKIVYWKKLELKSRLVASRWYQP
jgi:ribosomal protein S18 acetylase RimI-like enzyme